MFRVLRILSDISSEFHSVSDYKVLVLTATATWVCSKRRSVSHHWTIPSQLRKADFCGMFRCSVRLHYFNLVEGIDSLVKECLLLLSFLVFITVCMHVCLLTGKTKMHWHTWVCSMKLYLCIGLLWGEV